MESFERRQASTVPARVLETVFSTIPRDTLCKETSGGGLRPAYQIPTAANAMTISRAIAFFTLASAHPETHVVVIPAQAGIQ
jgi:hypothetical protein